MKIFDQTIFAEKQSWKNNSSNFDESDNVAMPKHSKVVEQRHDRLKPNLNRATEELKRKLSLCDGWTAT